MRDRAAGVQDIRPPPGVTAIGRGALLLMAVLAGGCAAVSLFWPLGWDHGVYAWIGTTVTSGGMPFRDAWDPKGPIVYLPFAAVSAAGSFPWAYRAADLVLLAGGCFAVAGVLHAAGYPHAASFAALALVIAHLSFGYWSTLQPDHWAGWLIAGAAGFSLRSQARLLRHWALAGGLVGLAGLIKPHYGILVVLPLLGAWGEGSAGRRERILATVAGTAIPVAAVGLWFLARGALEALADGYLLFTLEARLDQEPVWRTPLQGLRAVRRSLTFMIPLGALALVGLVQLWRRNRRQALLWATWAVLLLTGVVAQRRWFLYHWAPLIPPLLTLAAIGVVTTFAPASGTPARSWAPRLAVGSATLLALALALRPLARDGKAVASLLAGRLDHQAFLRRYRVPVLDYAADEIEYAARAVTRMTDQSDCVLVWPDPVVNVLSRRRIPGRFAHFGPLTRGTVTPRRARYRAEFLAGLEVRPPRLILLDTLATTSKAWFQGDLSIRFPEFLELVRRGYDSIGPIGKYSAWVSSGATAPPCR